MTVTGQPFEQLSDHWGISTEFNLGKAEDKTQEDTRFDIVKEGGNLAVAGENLVTPQEKQV